MAAEEWKIFVQIGACLVHHLPPIAPTEGENTEYSFWLVTKGAKNINSGKSTHRHKNLSSLR